MIHAKPIILSGDFIKTLIKERPDMSCQLLNVLLELNVLQNYILQFNYSSRCTALYSRVTLQETTASQH